MTIEYCQLQRAAQKFSKLEEEAILEAHKHDRANYPASSILILKRWLSIAKSAREEAAEMRRRARALTDAMIKA